MNRLIRVIQQRQSDLVNHVQGDARSHKVHLHNNGRRMPGKAGSSDASLGRPIAQSQHPTRPGKIGHLSACQGDEECHSESLAIS